MNLAGVLVHANPERAAVVQQALTQMPGVEVHAVSDVGKLVVTVEQEDDRQTAEAMMKFYEVEGVLSASMIYHHFECEPSEQEASQ